LLVLRARGLRSISRDEEADAVLNQAIERNPENWQAWSDRAFVQFHRHCWDAAADDFTRAIELAPHVHTNWWHRGHCYVNVAQWEKAAANFDRVLEEWPDGGEGWYLRGVALANLNQPKRAMKDLRQADMRGFRSFRQMRRDSRLFEHNSRDELYAML